MYAYNQAIIIIKSNQKSPRNVVKTMFFIKVAHRIKFYKNSLKSFTTSSIPSSKYCVVTAKSICPSALLIRALLALSHVNSLRMRSEPRVH